jgi:predicted DCC family thiol-disulfide oxidoreductase YuxK
MEHKMTKVIFFDGVCGLCNGFIDFIMSIDKEKKFFFSPLQSDFAKENLPAAMTTELKSVVYLKDEKILTKSQAVISVLNDVGGIWKIALIGKCLPIFVSNFFYDAIAEHRYKLFGKKETCRLPTPEERARFVI